MKKGEKSPFKTKRRASVCSVVSDSVTPWTIAHQVHLSMDFPGENTGMGCHFLLQGNLPNPGIKPGSPALQADSLPTEPPGKPREVLIKGATHI